MISMPVSHVIITEYWSGDSQDKLLIFYAQWWWQSGAFQNHNGFTMKCTSTLFIELYYSGRPWFNCLNDTLGTVYEPLNTVYFKLTLMRMTKDEKNLNVFYGLKKHPILL